MKYTTILALSTLALAHGAHAISWAVFSEQGCTGFLWGTSSLVNVTATACVQQGPATQSVRFADFEQDSVSCGLTVYTDSACSENGNDVGETDCLVLGATGHSYEITCV